MLLIIAAIIILLHGLIHIFGVLAFWKIKAFDDLPYSTKVLGGRVDIGTAGTYVLGLAWLAATVAYIVVSVGMFTEQDWWRDSLAAATVFSLVLTVLGWKDAVVGTVFNIIVLIALAV